MGILYQVAGYGVGFAAADPCKKNALTTAHAKNSTEQRADSHAYAAPEKITEEELQ